MNPKTSLFNRSIIKSDLKRHWWICALECVAVAMLCFAFYDSFSHRVYVPSPYTNILQSSMELMFLMQLFAPIATVALIFSYLNRSSSMTFMHALPVKRRTLFFSHMLSAAILLIIPIVLCAAVLMLIRFNHEARYCVSLHNILDFTVQSLVYMLLSASLTAFVVMLTGNTGAAMVLTVLLAALPAFADVMWNELLESFLYGYHSRGLPLCSLLYRSFYSVTPLYLAALTLLAAALAAGAMLLYRIRSLEGYGEVIAFAALKPVFTFAAAISAGFLGYLYFSDVTDCKNIFLLLPFGLLGIIAAHMLMKRQFTLRGAHRPAIVFVLFVLALAAGFKLDISGFERRIPELSDIESVRVEDVYSNNESIYKTYYGDREFSFMIEDAYDDSLHSAEDIDKVICLHSYLVKNRSDSRNVITLEYKLKNGRTMYRTYNVDYATDRAVYEPVAMLMKPQEFSVMDGTKKHDPSIVINHPLAEQPINVHDDSICEKISAALAADLAAMSYDDYRLNPQGSNLNIVLSYSKKLIPLNGLPSGVSGSGWEYRGYSDSYAIRPNYTNTLTLLDELGLMPEIPSADEIDYITLYRRSYSIGHPYASTYPVETDVNGDPVGVRISDPAQIEKIHAFCRDNMLNGKDAADGRNTVLEISVCCKSGYTSSLLYYNSAIPDWLLELAAQ